MSKDLHGAHGPFIFPKYQPVAIHGDPIHPLNDLTVAPRARESYRSPPWKGVNTGGRESYRRPLGLGECTIAPRGRELTCLKGVIP